MKVLFVGNSHTYMNDMPQLFREIVEKTTGAPCEVTMLAFSGRHLSWHLTEYFSLRFALLYGGFDFCVIQQAAHPFPPREETLADGEAIVQLCRATHTEPVLYMTWAEKRQPENQAKMIETYEALARQTHARLAPVGVVWQRLQKAHPGLELFYKDGEHASPYGDLLIAAVLCREITDRADILLPDHVRDFHWQIPDMQHISASLDDREIREPIDTEKARWILEAMR